MKKVVGLGIVALLIIAVVGGGTWAYFSDFESSTGNVLMAGTLDVGLSNTAGLATGSITETWNADNWAPGSTENGTLYISDSGTIDIKTLTLVFSYTSVDTSGRPTNIKLNDPLQDTDSFDKMITVSRAIWKGYDLDENLTDQIVGLTLFQLNNAPVTLSAVESLQAGEQGALDIEFYFDSNATNGCQGNKIDVTVTVTGTQN